MKTNKLPLASICIPTYNGESYLEDCMTSAINQTYKNLEIIVSDDASLDNTLQIVEAFKSKTKIPIYTYSHTPKGIGANWNNCIKHANGKYIKFLFQDDILKPNCVEKLVDLMLSNPDIAMVYAKRNFIFNEETEQIKAFKKVYGNLHQSWKNLNVKHGVLDGKAYLKDANFLSAPKNKIGEPTSVLLKKTVFDKVGLFNKDLKQALDCEFWYRLMPHYKIGFVDEVLSSFRLHSQQASALNKSNKINETEVLYKIYYKNLVPYLSKENQWKLKKRFHPIIFPLAKLKAKFS